MRVLVTGAGGQLGRDLLDMLTGRLPAGGISWLSEFADAPIVTDGRQKLADEVSGLDHTRLDVSDPQQVAAAFDALRPELVFHCAAWTAVDACESDPQRAFAINAMGTRHVAEAARRHGTHVVYLSTDYVFDGTSETPYLESDAPNPLSVYGRSKLAGEHELDPVSTIVRTAWVCGFHGANMARTVLRLAEMPGPLRFVDDQRGSPTFTADLAPALCHLGRDRVPGVFHLTNHGDTTWYGFARAVLESSGGDPDRVQAVATSELEPPRPAPRPANSVLVNAAWRELGLPALPAWEDGLARLVSAWTTASAGAL